MKFNRIRRSMTWVGRIKTPSPICASPQSSRNGGPRAGDMCGGSESTPMCSRILLICVPSVIERRSAASARRTSGTSAGTSCRCRPHLHPSRWPKQPCQSCRPHACRPCRRPGFLPWPRPCPWPPDPSSGLSSNNSLVTPSSRPLAMARPDAVQGNRPFLTLMPWALAWSSVRPTHATSGSV